MTIDNFRINDIVSAYIAFLESDGGKQRPALVVGTDNKTLEVLKITSKYDRKSNKVKAQRYKLEDWMYEGLDKQSYVDIKSLQKIYLPEQRFIKKKGVISERDLEKLAKFIEDYH